MIDRRNHAKRCIDTRQLLDHNRVGDIVQPGAAILFVDRDAEEAELAHFLDQIGRPVHCLVARSSGRASLFLGKLAYRLAKQLMIFGGRETQGMPLALSSYLDIMHKLETSFLLKLSKSCGI